MRGSIGIVGAGNMGSGIAQKYAAEGFAVTVVDSSEEALMRSKSNIKRTLDEGLARKVFSLGKVDNIWKKLAFSTDFSALADTSLVVEAVFEDQAVKHTVFKKLDEVCTPQTIFATNTSSFYVSDLAFATKRPERFVGLHYFYHPAKNKLVEVIRGKQTSQETFATAWQIQEQIGKIAIESKDAPGFVVNRFFVPWLNEAMRIVHDGIANIVTVEAAAKKAFGISMGPFELMNITGVPITLHTARQLAKELGEFYAPCPMILSIVEKGLTWDLTGEIALSRAEQITERLLGVVFKVSNQLVCAEGVCSVEDCDLGARVGLRWPKGPFELMHGAGMSKPRPQYATLQKENGVAKIFLNRPDALNALNETLIAQLDAHFDDITRDPSVKGIILGGRGKAFAAGADTQFFVENMRGGSIERIIRFASRAQHLFRLIDLCDKPVVCCIDGLALGGGLELALACDYILATPRARLGFPETGIGIYPGLGGTQRTPRRVGIPLARWLVLSGELVDADMAKALGLVDEVVNKDDLHSRAMSLALTGAPRMESSPPQDTPANFIEVCDFFRAPLEDLLSHKKVGAKAPIALRMADTLISSAHRNSLDLGLSAETEGLAQIFSTKDALLGLSSIGKVKPVFSGE